MSQSLDMATALELTMDGEHEAKFLALKGLHTKKLKSLMSSIDAKDKEIAKLKILGKDNRRAQMIQELRKKIRTHETINDILKEEMQKRTETTVEEANALIIRKTLAGPKRFRPLSREELENKIFELEKKLSKKGSSGNNGTLGASGNNVNASFDAKSEGVAQPKRTSGYGNEHVNSEKVDDVGKFITLVEEIDDLRRTIRAKDSVLDSQKEEIIRLRSRNAQLVVIEEEADYQEKQYAELKIYNDSVLVTLDDTTKKLADALEVSIRMKADTVLENEARFAEIDALQKQNEKYMRQHAQLLSSIAALEVEREQHSTNVHQNRQHTSAVELTVTEKDTIIKQLEDKLARMEERLRISEKKCAQLSSDLLQVDALKEQLREKSIAYKELKRNLDERAKLKTGASVGASSMAALSRAAEAKDDGSPTNNDGKATAK
jgi:hypothetical protein